MKSEKRSAVIEEAIDGCTVGRIAKRHGLSVDAVKSLCRSAKVDLTINRHSSINRLANIKRDMERGRHWKSLDRYYGLSHQMYTKLRLELGVNPRRVSDQADLCSDTHSYFMSHTADETAEHFGICKETVYLRCRAHRRNIEKKGCER